MGGQEGGQDGADKAKAAKHAFAKIAELAALFSNGSTFSRKEVMFEKGVDKGGTDTGESKEIEREALGFNFDRVGRGWVVSLALLVQPAAHKDSISDQSSKSSKESGSNEQLTLPRLRLCPRSSRSSGGGSKSSPEEAGANATSGVSTGRSAVGSTICWVVGASVSKNLLGGLGLDAIETDLET